MQDYGFAAPLAYGYCRKSTNGQREESIEAQQRAIVAYAAACGYKLVKIYKDHGNSGRNGERPQFSQMVADAIAGGAQYIIVHKLDRFFRNAERQTLVEAQERETGKTAATVEELCRVWGGIRLDKLPPEQMRTLIRELVEKIIVYDDGPNAHRVRVVLNPGKVRPPDQPPDYVSTPFDKLGTLLDRTVDGLPLPPLPGNVVVLPQGLLVTEFSMFRR